MPFEQYKQNYANYHWYWSYDVISGLPRFDSLPPKTR
jgi:hypothetical protein